ncbi:MAG: DUF5372 family protein [Acidiferrobacteraceae bacterium]
MAPAGDGQSRRFRVTHPYHPLFSQEFELVLRAQNWREDRVWFYDVAERLRSLPADWTSAVAEDPFNVIGAGRAAFRVEELLELARLIGRAKP